MGETERRPTWRVAVGLGLVCAAVLVFQVALTRIFSFITWYHLTFLAISLALLGFGASGTYLAVRGAGSDVRPPGPRRSSGSPSPWPSS